MNSKGCAAVIILFKAVSTLFYFGSASSIPTFLSWAEEGRKPPSSTAYCPLVYHHRKNLGQPLYIASEEYEKPNPNMNSYHSDSSRQIRFWPSSGRHLTGKTSNRILTGVTCLSTPSTQSIMLLVQQTASVRQGWGNTEEEEEPVLRAHGVCVTKTLTCVDEL